MLRGVDLVARPGETTAVIGSTGSGKTTLINLVPRLFDVTGGTTLVDGVDVRELDPALLSRTVGLVPQKPYLFSGTIASNLRYGRPDATDEELWQALDIAQARDFVEAMPEQLERADRPGRQQRLRRPAAAARDRPGAGPPAGDLPVRRLVLGPGLRDRRRAAGGAGPGDRRRDGRHRRPAGQHHPRRRPDRRARRGPGRRYRHPRRADDRQRDLPGDRALPADRAGGRG